MVQEASQVLSDTVVAVFRANGCLLEWGDAFAEPLGVTSARWQILGALAQAGGPLTAPQMGARMGVSRQGPQKQLNLLVADGLMEKRPNPAHARSPLYYLTPAGGALFARIDQAWKEHTRSVAQEFSPEELAITLKVLEALAARHRRSASGDDHDA